MIIKICYDTSRLCIFCIWYHKMRKSYDDRKIIIFYAICSDSSLKILRSTRSYRKAENDQRFIILAENK